ncbi:single-stranded DNA-binding protein [Candidatus Clostridium radicumherbarum]|uniref:Single-stranded DNA-binding protein n=1 Tax=Candidatus Clostridium radicumherbarum TaxID=3381662 RepID=A0ABW8TSC9_9CLOT
MNRVVLIGRLTKDPEMKVFEESGKVNTKFTLAVERSFKNKNGEREADFIPVTFWGKRAEIVNEHLVKGKLISVTGRLQTHSYEDAEGKRKYIAEVIADEFQFIDSKKKEENII